MKWLIVRTHAGWHAKFVGSNGEPIAWTEVYQSRTDANRAIELVTSLDYAFRNIEDVDER